MKDDTISRQAAIDALDKRFDNVPMEQTTEILLLRKDLRELPSAEPEIIHCKDCKRRGSDDCPMYYEEWIEIDEGDGCFDTDNIIHDWTTDEGFCHCAKLRGEQE